MKFLILTSILVFYAEFIWGQLSFYGGYKVGRFQSVEAPFDNLSTKFNLGWDFDISADKGVVSLKPGSNTYTIDNKMTYTNFPHGIEFGLYTRFLERFGFQAGFNAMNNKVSGKRENTTLGVTETFSLKSRTGAITLNFSYFLTERIAPFIGVDMGITKIRYSYSNGTEEIKNQLAGYRLKGLSLGTVVGDKEKVFSLNTGLNLVLLNHEKWKVNLVPQAQFRLSKSTKIDQGIYYPLLFNHSNYSLSIWLTYEL